MVKQGGTPSSRKCLQHVYQVAFVQYPAIDMKDFSKQISYKASIPCSRQMSNRTSISWRRHIRTSDTEFQTWRGRYNQSRSPPKSSSTCLWTSNSAVRESLKSLLCVGWLRVDKSHDAYGPSRVENLTKLWESINLEVLQSGHGFFDLDSFLYGKWDDPSLQGVESALIERHFLPVAQDENPSKKAKTGDPAWPDMHKRIFHENNVIWQQHFSMVHAYSWPSLSVYHCISKSKVKVHLFSFLTCPFHRSKIQIKGTVRYWGLARIATMQYVFIICSWNPSHSRLLHPVCKMGPLLRLGAGLTIISCFQASLIFFAIMDGMFWSLGHLSIAGD